MDTPAIRIPSTNRPLWSTSSTSAEVAEWDATAVMVPYDDSDGWYDHRWGPSEPVEQPDDTLNCPGPAATVARSPGINQATAFTTALRLWSAPASAGVFSLGAGELRGPHRHRPILDDALYRRQLAGRTTDRGGGSFDSLSNSIVQMFDFRHSRQEDRRLFLDPGTGEPVSRSLNLICDNVRPVFSAAARMGKNGYAEQSLRMPLHLFCFFKTSIPFISA